MQAGECGFRLNLKKNIHGIKRYNIFKDCPFGQPLSKIYQLAFLICNLNLSEIIAINSLLVGLPLSLWIV